MLKQRTWRRAEIFGPRAANAGFSKQPTAEKRGSLFCKRRRHTTRAPAVAMWRSILRIRRSFMPRFTRGNAHRGVSFPVPARPAVKTWAEFSRARTAAAVGKNWVGLPGQTGRIGLAVSV